MKRVIIYTSPICFYCEKAKKLFTDKNIAFTEIDIFENKEKAEEMITKSGQKRVPVIDIDGKIFTGFNKKDIEQALEQ